MKLKFLTPVDYDGKRYQPGESTDVKRADVDGLIEVGAAEPFDAKAAAKAEAEAQAQAKADAEAQAARDREAAAAAELLKANGGQPPAGE